MATSEAKRLRWFDLGAAAFERDFPGYLAARFGQGTQAYVCPLCDKAFRREAVALKVLSAEHVPPKSFGGRELLLTCWKCNNDAGAKVDAAARKKENIVDTLIGGLSPKQLKVRVTHGGHKVNASLTRGPGGFVIEVYGRNNNPETFKRFHATGAPTAGTSIGFEFVDRYCDRPALVSWLRSGYLAMFAWAGYRFAFDPGVRLVREQLREPTRQVLEHFAIEIPAALPSSQRQIIEVKELDAAGVQLGRYVVFFPNRFGDVGFYERLAQRAEAAKYDSVSTLSIGWPTEPVFGHS